MVSFRNSELDLEFEVSITGYEFPDIASGPDADWLNVSIECRYRGQVFVTTDPSLDARELGEICNWFDSISRTTVPKTTYLSFTEPNLEFQLYGSQNGTIRFGIVLRADCKPPFHIRELAVEPDDEFFMVFESSLDEVSDTSAQFDKLMASFPQRDHT